MSYMHEGTGGGGGGGGGEGFGNNQNYYGGGGFGDASNDGGFRGGATYDGNQYGGGGAGGNPLASVFNSMGGNAPFGDANNLMLNVGMQYGQNILKDGQAGLARYLPFFQDIRRYFRVDNGYVRSKLGILFFPFFRRFTKMLPDASYTFGPSSTSGQAQGAPSAPALCPMEDVNAFDLYIPTMAFITYVTLCAFIRGYRSESEYLHFSFLSGTLYSIVLWNILEVIVLKAMRYIMGVIPDLSFLDCMALCGYKYVVVCVLLLLREILWNVDGTTNVPYYILVAYSIAASGFFVLRTVSHVYKREDNRVPPNARMLAIVAALLQTPVVLWFALKSV